MLGDGAVSHHLEEGRPGGFEKRRGHRPGGGRIVQADLPFKQSRKLLERLLCGRLQEHRANRGVHPNQYGFKPRKSTGEALNRVIAEKGN